MDHPRRPCGATMRARRGRAAAAVLVLLLAAGGTPALGDTAGQVAGRVRLSAPHSVERSLPVVKHKEVCGDKVADDRLVVGPEGGLRYAVVTVEGVQGGTPPEPDVTHVLDNRECRFVPHVQVAEVGQWLEIRNSDPILHNADAWIAGKPVFNVGLPPGDVKRKRLDRPGLLAIKCDVGHTWMNAVVAVAEHPYHTVTDAYGDYEIRDVPPGRYTLRVWQEELGTVERPVTVAAGERATVDVDYPGAAPQEK